jgi:hypothetical protein
VLCDKVLQEQDGVLSLIRVVDRIFQTAVGPTAPTEMPLVAVNLTLVVMFKSGDARGRYPMTIRLEAPSGQVVNEMQFPVLLEGEGDRGANLTLGVQLQLDQEGLYWFDVLFGDEQRMLARVPLRIVYQPQRTA